jgi:HlyD family secretion protein
MNRLGSLVAVVLLLASSGCREGLFRNQAENNALAASGTVEATDAQLGFPATGRIELIAVREGDRVRAGMELARLDGKEIAARREEAQARIESTRAQLVELERGFRSEEVAQAKAARNAAQQKLADTERDLERTRTLSEGGALPHEALEKAELAQELAESALAQAEEQLALLEAGPRPEKISAQRAALAQAEASVRAIDAVIANLTVTAPFDGVITVRHREPGETVPAGSPVLTLMNPEDRWVKIYVREDRVAAVRIGAPAEIRCDTYPDKRYKGEVRFIASEAEFTPKNVQTQEERVRLVYAVEVQITDDPEGDLKPGMPADVRLDVNPL